MGTPHKWAEVIKQWADGEAIHYRLWRKKADGTSEWDAWKKLTTPPVREDMFIEYRVEPKAVPHRWQNEKELFLAGFPVEFKSKESNSASWRVIDQWLVDTCAKDKDGPIWDREWLEFRSSPSLEFQRKKVAVTS